MAKAANGTRREGDSPALRFMCGGDDTMSLFVRRWPCVLNRQERKEKEGKKCKGVRKWNRYHKENEHDEHAMETTPLSAAGNISRVTLTASPLMPTSTT